MSVCVKSVKYDRFDWVLFNKLYELICPSRIEIILDDGRKIIARLSAGFKTDGASIPSAFQWFLKGWDKDNDLYNIAPSIHDALYATAGAGGAFTREECDDILRGIWRCAGLSRFKAGVADKCVEWFAGGDNHWGNDDNDIRSHVRFTIKEMK